MCAHPIRNTFATLFISLLIGGCSVLDSSGNKQDRDLEIIVTCINLAPMDILTSKLDDSGLKVWNDKGLIYKSEITEEEWVALEFHKNALDELEHHYNGNMIDGFIWKVFIRDGARMDYVLLHETEFEQTNQLFLQVKELLPNKLAKEFIVRPVKSRKS